MKRWIRPWAVVWGGLLAATAANGQINKLSSDLTQLLSQLGTSTTVIVQFQQAPTALDLLNLQLLGGSVQQTYSVIPAVLVKLPVASLLSVVNLLDVVYVSPNRNLVGLLDSTAPTVNAPAAWQA